MDTEEVRDKVIEAIKTVYDPEIPVNIWELGLIYGVDVPEVNQVFISMTLTAPSCPSAQEIPLEVEEKVRAVEGIEEVDVSVVWDPPWDKSMMSEAAMLDLGFL